MHAVIKDKLKETDKLCRDYQVSKLYTFGSVNTGKFDIDSFDSVN